MPLTRRRREGSEPRRAALPTTREFAKLVSLVDTLRSPGGCPWDRAQTHETLIRYLREEARELEEALQRGDWHEIEDELGDLLLQILLHARIKKEEGVFDMEDVARSQYLKLRRRHPHVFGDKRWKTPDEVLANWKDVKAFERGLRAKDLEARARRRNGGRKSPARRRR